jgi:hypothetical protein
VEWSGIFPILFPDTTWGAFKVCEGLCISLPLLQRRPVYLRSENFISTRVEVHWSVSEDCALKCGLADLNTPPLSAKDVLQDWKWNCSGTCKICALCVCVGNLLSRNWYISWNAKILIRHTSENILHWAFHLWKEHSFANLRSSKHLWNTWKRKLALVPTKTVDMACKCYSEIVHCAIYKCQSHGFGLWQSAFWAVVTCSKMGSAETRAPTCSLGDVSTLLSYQPVPLSQHSCCYLFWPYLIVGVHSKDLPELRIYFSFWSK